MVPVIHNVQVEDHLKLVCLLESVDSLTHRDVFLECKDVRGHDPTGRLLLVAEKILDLD